MKKKNIILFLTLIGGMTLGYAYFIETNWLEITRHQIYMKSNSNKKLSKMGKVLLLLMTLPNTCNCFNKYELDTINFMCIVLFFWILYKLG